jgi:hypothetical protein
MLECIHRDYCTVLVDCPTIACGLSEFMDAVLDWGADHGVRPDRGSAEDRARIAIGVTELYCKHLGFDQRALGLETLLYHAMVRLRCDPIEAEERVKTKPQKRLMLRTYPYGPKIPTRLTNMIHECLRRCNDGDCDQSDIYREEACGLPGGESVEPDPLEKAIRVALS